MGDVLSLIEDAQSRFDAESAAKTAEKIKQNKLDFNDLLDQLTQVKKMGSIKSLLSKIPGVEKQIRDVDIDDRQDVYKRQPLSVRSSSC